MAKEKEELIGCILELQNTLHDLSQRVNSVKEENAKLKAENQVAYPRPIQCTLHYTMTPVAVRVFYTQ